MSPSTDLQNDTQAAVTKTWGRRLTACVAIGVALASVSACGSQSSAGTTLAAAEGDSPVEGRPTPVENATGGPVKIAIVSFPSALAEFFSAYEAGAERAGSVLAAEDATVDYIPVTTISPDAVNTAVRTAMTQGYDAIALQVLSSANCAVIKEAVAKDITVGVINGTSPCVQESGAIFYHGENPFPAYKDTVAQAMIEATEGQTCKVGIITAGFSIETIEQRRLGFVAGLEGSNLTPVDKGIETGVDPAKVQAAARDYANANPDLCGLLVDFSDNGAAASALSDEQAEKISVISADITSGTEAQIRSGKQYGGFTQDPFGHTYDSAIWLYNAVVTGEGPSGGFEQPSTGEIVTATNLDAAVRAQDEGQ